MCNNKKYYCKHCGKEFKTNNGRNGHTPYCKENPNRRQAWNKGLTKDTSESVARYSESGKKTKAENYYPAWNKGLTKDTDDRVKQYGNSVKKTKNNLIWKKQHLEKVYKKYNGSHFTQTEEYKEKRKQLFLEKYGYENPNQVPEIHIKNIQRRYKMKEYTFPSGKLVKVQGYEPYALDWLLNNHHLEEDIKTGIEVPRIRYHDANKKVHIYYPDIYIVSKNLIVEVKSIYTLVDNKEKNIQKQKKIHK